MVFHSVRSWPALNALTAAQQERFDLVPVEIPDAAPVTAEPIGEIELVDDLDVLVESSKRSCNAGDDNPDALDPEVFDEVIAAAAVVMLPFDKDRRWSTSKSEIVLVDEIVHRPISRSSPRCRGEAGGTIKSYIYSATRPDTAALRVGTRRSKRAVSGECTSAKSRRTRSNLDIVPVRVIQLLPHEHASI